MGHATTNRCATIIRHPFFPAPSFPLPEAALELCKQLREIGGLELRGLMCLPPEGRVARPFFAELRQLREDVSRQLGQELPDLSMGMSSDFEDAVREGSTLVRVGTAIFGER